MGDEREWLVTDGLGGFASGTPSLTRTRREHALLVAASPRDTRRWVLVSALDAVAELDAVRIPLSSHRYAPATVYPDGARRVLSFAAEPWPTWRLAVADGVELVHELFMPRGRAATFISWRLVTTRDVVVRLRVRPLLAMRELAALHSENAHFRFEPRVVDDHVLEWNTYEGVPPVVVHADGEYQHDPVWYRHFSYSGENDDGTVEEDLAAPGAFVWRLQSGSSSRAELMISVPEEWTGYRAPGELGPIARAVRESERARIAAYRSRLFHSADAYVITRSDTGRGSIVPTYPPPARESARDVFAALRGICLATARLDEAERVLESWCDEVAASVSRPPVEGATDEQVSVDGPLWFVVAVQEFLTAAARRGYWLDDAVPRRLTDACQEVLEQYARGTHSGIRMTDDGLLAAGEPGSALTWMNAYVDGVPVTARVGKPVEVQALWINALTVGARWSERWGDVGEQATRSFAERFWNEERLCLFDVVDVGHVAGAVDARVRPNQLLAVGGLPAMALTGDRARHVVDTVERLLWTPAGPRTLSPDDEGYVGRRTGDARARARAMHQGTVWPWLTGAFVDAWVRVRAAERSGGGDRIPLTLLRSLRAEARKRFLRTLARRLDTEGIGHVSEMADGDEGHEARGAAFSSLALGEVGRVLLE